MRFIHLADLHLGKMVNAFSMIDDQAYILRQVKAYIEQYKPDAVLLAGDIYDRSVPPARAVSLYSQFLKELLIELKTPVLAIAGNHDGPEMLGFGHELFEAANYYVAGNYVKEIKKVTLADEGGAVHFYLLPFADYAVVRENLENKTIKSLEDAMRETIKEIKLDPCVRNVLVTHAYVSGPQPLLPSESEKKLVIGGKESVPVSLFKDFDYVALGHLHRPQYVETQNVRYSGSILKYSFSEEKDSKSITMIDMDEGGAITHTLLPLKPRYQMRTVTGTLEQLLDRHLGAEREDYLRVILTDEGELIEPMAKLRQRYPNIMVLELERNLNEFFKQSDLNQEDRMKKTTTQLFADFYIHHRKVCLSELGEQVINDVLNDLEKKEA